MKAKAWLAILLGLGLFLSLTLSLRQTRAQEGGTLYVAPGGDCGGQMPCFDNAQDAVDAAQPGDEIRVAAGIYKGVRGRPAPGGYYGPDVVTQAVYISKTLTLRGGYTMADWTTSNPVANPTTLAAWGQGRVLFISGDITVTVEGLWITGGDADGLGGVPWGRDVGGGVYVISATATISDNQVSGNIAGYGGGLYLWDSNATLIDNTISSNYTYRGNGGGLYLDGSDASLIGNTISSNHTYRGSGGGLCLDESDATLSGNTITSNTAPWGWGGGLYLVGSSATLINNLVADNQASSRGSGLFIAGSSSRLLHTTVARNSGGDSSGIYVTLVFLWRPPGWEAHLSNVALTNTILVSHTVGITVTESNMATLEATLWGADSWANTIDWGGAGTIITGTHNYWGDPTFVDPGAGDYHISPGSAAINAGIDAKVRIDIDHEPRPYQGYDLGADEYWPPGALKRIYLPLLLRKDANR